jgi:hypothetical protein
MLVMLPGTAHTHEIADALAARFQCVGQSSTFVLLYVIAAAGSCFDVADKAIMSATDLIESAGQGK